MITDLLARLFSLLSSDPELLARFEAQPDDVLAEAGLGECSLSELADALPLAVAGLPSAQATLILDRCGPEASWTGDTVSEVLSRVVHEPDQAPTWADVAEEPPIEEDAPAEEQPPAAEEPPVEETPPAEEAPPAEEDPGRAVLEPPSEPGREFLDFKSALRAAREAIAAGDAEALEDAVQSVEPGARAELADSLRSELLVTGTPADDPLVGLLEEQIVAAGGTPTEPVDEPVADSDDAVADDVTDDAADDAAAVVGDESDGDAPAFDAQEAAEKLGELTGSGDFDAAGSLLEQLSPDQRAAVIDQVANSTEGEIDPFAAVIIRGIDPNAEDFGTALQESLEAVRARAEEAASDEPADAGDEVTTGEGITKGGADDATVDGTNGSGELAPGGADQGQSIDQNGNTGDAFNPFEPNPPTGSENGAAADGAAGPPVVAVPPTRPTEDDDEDLDFGAGALPTPLPPGETPPSLPVVAVPPSPAGSVDDPTAAPADEAADDVFGGDDFFGGEASSGEVIPIDSETGAEDAPEEIVGGDDFFGIDPAPSDSGDGDGGGGLTPEQLAELAAINDETADAIIDNLDG